MKFCESSKVGNPIIKRPSCNGKNRKTITNPEDLSIFAGY